MSELEIMAYRIIYITLFVCLFILALFLVLCIIHLVTGDDRRWVSFLIVLFGVPLLLYGTKHTLETLEEQQQTIQNEIQKQSETIVVTSVKKNMYSDYTIVNDTYQVSTNIEIPKGAIITIKKNTTDDIYSLIEYEIK